MNFRPLLLACACVAAVATAACDGDRGVRITSTTTDNSGAKGVLKVIDTLQCPQTMGSLTRKGSATAGGTVCTYVGRKGAEVSLHLVQLDGGSTNDVLKAFEARLSGDLPDAIAELRAAAAAEQARVARADADAAKADAEAARADADAARAAAQAAGDHASVSAPGVRVEARGDDASVRLPGISIDSKGDNASVRIGNFHIDAKDSGDGEKGATVDISASDDGDQVSINARNNAAEVRTRSGGEALRASWILTQNRAAASGLRLVGYEARGPARGPIVVATVRSRDTNRDAAFNDAKDLVTLNVGE